MRVITGYITISVTGRRTIMVSNNIQNIVIVGGDSSNGSRFVTNIHPVKLDVDMEMAITSVYHGPVLNVTEDNNRVYYADPYRGTDEDLDEDPPRWSVGTEDMVIIAPGLYKNAHTLLKAISDALKSKSRSKRLMLTLDKDNNLTITVRSVTILVKATPNTPWDMLNIKSDYIAPDMITSLENIDFDLGTNPGFLYASIIENSYINGRLSRLLSVIPLSNGKEGGYHHFAYPNFVPITVKEFSDIVFEVRNMNGEYLKFDPAHKAVLSLSIRPINRE
jgi:hypothetical protein